MIEQWLSDNCPKCGEKNFVNNGDPDDMTICDIDGIKCWNCRHEWLMEPIIDPDLRIENAHIEDGNKPVT